MIHSPSHNLLYIIGRPLTAYEDPKQLINIMFTLRKRLSRILHRWGWRGGKTEPLGGSNDHQSQIGWWRPQKKRNWDCYNSTICRWPWLTLTKHHLRHSWRFEEDGDDGRVRTKVQPSLTDPDGHERVRDMSQLSDDDHLTHGLTSRQLSHFSLNPVSLQFFFPSRPLICNEGMNYSVSRSLQSLYLESGICCVTPVCSLSCYSLGLQLVGAVEREKGHDTGGCQQNKMSKLKTDVCEANNLISLVWFWQIGEQFHRSPTVQLYAPPLGVFVW